MNENTAATTFLARKILIHIFFIIEGIELKIEGYAECQWSEERHSEEGAGEQRHSETTFFSGHEQYLNSINELVSSEQSKLEMNFEKRY